MSRQLRVQSVIAFVRALARTGAHADPDSSEAAPCRCSQLSRHSEQAISILPQLKKLWITSSSHDCLRPVQSMFEPPYIIEPPEVSARSSLHVPDMRTQLHRRCTRRKVKTRPLSNFDILSCSQHQHGTFAGARPSHTKGATQPLAEWPVPVPSTFTLVSRASANLSVPQIAMCNLQHKRTPHSALKYRKLGPTITHLTKPLATMSPALPSVRGLPESKLCCPPLIRS